MLALLQLTSEAAVFLVKVALKICRKFTGEHACRIVNSMKLLSNFIEITLWHRCSAVNFLHIFGRPFTKNTSGWLLLWRYIYNFGFRYLQILIVSLACSTGHKECLNNTKEMFNNWKAKNQTWVLVFNGWYFRDISGNHFVKSVRIRIYSGPHFPALGLNTRKYGQD